jgi:hypothetical protein
MSKKKRKAGRAKPGAVVSRSRRVRWAKAAVVAPLLLCMIAVGVASLRWGPVRRAAGLAPLSEPLTQATPTPLSLSKEYVYAGGRLVATEQPPPQPSGPPPTNLIATSSIPSSGPLVVSLTWSAPSAGGSPTGYVVERAQTRDGTGLRFTPLTPTVTSPPSPGSPYLDQSPPSGVVCVYRVRATYPSGVSDSYSNMDVATTVAYTGDDPLIGANHQPGQHASIVSTKNLTELQGVVDAVRALAGLGSVVWKNNPSPQSGGQILVAHFLELRTNLNPALQALGISQMPDDATLGQGKAVMAAHIQDVREKVR